MSRLKSVCVPLLLLTVVAFLEGCGSSAETTVTGPTPTLVTETFTGSLEQNGTAIHSFTVNSSGYTLLAGFTSLSPASVAALGIGLGSWDASASTCSLNLTQADAARSGSTALSGTANSGSYCVRVYDGANIPAGVTATYVVQVQHY